MAQSIAEFLWMGKFGKESGNFFWGKAQKILKKKIKNFLKNLQISLDIGGGGAKV
jgi:hypothetical protein